ncbi:hypothetical protein L1887_16810 [Cichorium endivia]|nr:hypothetical protein L1887_16810 [Cichorium endivia]
MGNKVTNYGAGNREEPKWAKYIIQVKSFFVRRVPEKYITSEGNRGNARSWKIDAVIQHQNDEDAKAEGEACFRQCFSTINRDHASAKIFY